MHTVYCSKKLSGGDFDIMQLQHLLLNKTCKYHKLDILILILLVEGTGVMQGHYIEIVGNNVSFCVSWDVSPSSLLLC